MQAAILGLLLVQKQIKAEKQNTYKIKKKQNGIRGLANSCTYIKIKNKKRNTEFKTMIRVWKSLTHSNAAGKLFTGNHD